MSKAAKAAKRRHSQQDRVASSPDGSRLLEQAEAALAGGLVDAACQLLTQARDIGTNPRGRELFVTAFAAQAFDRWEKPARALVSLERALLVAPTDLELVRLRGTLLRRAGRSRPALAELDRACRGSLVGTSARLEMVLAKLAAGERGPQLSAIADGFAKPYGELAAAILAAAEGDLAKAEQVLAQSTQPLAGLMLGIVLLAKGEAHAALPALRQSASDPTLPGQALGCASFYLGIAHVQRRNNRQAAEAFEEAIQRRVPVELVGDHLAWAYNQLVIDAVLDQDLARATDWLMKLSELGGPLAQAARENVGYALRLSGQEKARAKDYDEAARLWAGALAILPRDFVLRQNLAVALERANRADEAIPHWHELVQQLSKGAGRTGKGRDNGAIDADNRALSIQLRALAHRHLADLYLEEDDVDRGITQMERALAVMPEDRDTRFELARLLLEEGSERKAIAHLERLADDGVASLEVLLCLGAAYRVARNLDAAVQVLERAYHLAPESPLVRLSLGVAMALRAINAPAVPSALVDVHSALGLLPRGQFSGLLALGAVQLCRGKRTEAIRTLRKCVREATDKTSAALEAGRVYCAAGERELASQAWLEAMKKAKRAPGRFRSLAIEWAAAGEVERCKECLLELLSRGLLGEAIGVTERASENPAAKLVLNRVLVELIPWAKQLEHRIFVADRLLHCGNLSAAKTLITQLAWDSLAADDYRGINCVVEFDYRYRRKLLDRNVALAVVAWLDAHDTASEATDGRF